MLRADILLANKINISRNQAANLLKNNKVLINGEIKKPSDLLDENAKIEILDEIYVSRAAYKLKGFFDEFNLDISDFECLDVGSSTGGFTQILLSKNAKSITCVDVGNNQLHSSLRANEKIRIYENTDIRHFEHKEFDLVTCDVSFISLSLILNDLIRLSKKYLVILFKPQFEVGKNIKRNKKGVVMDKKAINDACLEFEKNCLRLGLILEKKAQSILSGKEGNFEYFYAFKK